MPADAPELLVLQRCCWLGEGRVNDTWDIPPLVETLDDVRASSSVWRTWVVRSHGRLIASVRGRVDEDGTWEAVSYTHLDVYKRQHQHGARVWRPKNDPVAGPFVQPNIPGALRTGDQPEVGDLGWSGLLGILQEHSTQPATLPVGGDHEPTDLPGAVLVDPAPD